MEITSSPSHHFRLVDHAWTGSYLLKPYGRHYRKDLHILSKITFKANSDWVGDSVWGSPVVALAPPQHS